MNAVFFAFLQTLLTEPVAISAFRHVAAEPIHIGVQLLDSKFNESWRMAAA
jgi:hypothetical protein